MTIVNIVGAQVRKLRKEQKLTQEQLSARCNVIGLDISRGTLAKIEAGVRQVIDTEIVQLATALKVEEKDLFPRRIDRINTALY
ncbi:helix-turn-helix domain-containing protein [Vibrio parahaemolyticus]|uniref:helix-turn-helix domain-containing protein n=3 Tax=Vibrio parahaemolyticus TaxID=670 RepID=UPI00037E463D|nr:helix-turn-helix transcriptional regulator [Vibrio parahaemolyticus]EGQ8804382.1 helix-turn-helix domain-containing protein [Vibrio parahaemolyticus]EGQ8888628.1 helix-turn-helix domain-containing protein [Vibrio parahaemolyticus]EGQ8963649.1 helix-turn-helix domain-containing protein [Vibrio parahaemolyticus]EGR2853620.1 XRE family transcriptional regulator [Vibrio parahaemolyticus]EGR3168752.1 XRE family transcriptional regulator [Vibrio parahaemolyticus]